MYLVALTACSSTRHGAVYSEVQARQYHVRLTNVQSEAWTAHGALYLQQDHQRNNSITAHQN